MNKIHFSIQIKAPVEKVWNTMLNDDTYRLWTTVFMPGSYYEGNLDKGSIVKFLAPDENGIVGGMLSKIEDNIPNEFISIRHLGFIRDGVEDTTSEEVKAWAGALENYTFKQNGDTTELLIDIDVNPEMEDMFNGMWPKALDILKEISEK